jgi:hypothetical protein
MIFTGNNLKGHAGQPGVVSCRKGSREQGERVFPITQPGLEGSPQHGQ